MALRMEEATRNKIQRWYSAADRRSMNEFVEKAIHFYADHLDLQEKNTLLPGAIQSAIDGRISMTENRLSSILFQQAAELDDHEDTEMNQAGLQMG